MLVMVIIFLMMLIGKPLFNITKHYFDRHSHTIAVRKKKREEWK